MEKLLHYIWKHKLFPLRELLTEDGRTVEVIDPGLHNTNAGPDFFNAKVRIGGTLWVGNVEIHCRATDWFAHHHEQNPQYDNVILHVCGTLDGQAVTADGHTPPQLQLDIPPLVAAHYNELLNADRQPPCQTVIPTLPLLTVHSWLSTLQTERLEQKTRAIEERVGRCDGSWEAAYFVTLARNFGFGVNGEAFEEWAYSVPLQSVAHHRDDLFQIEAMFLGQAGLLSESAIPERYRAEALADDYYVRLLQEYSYLQRKFGLVSIDRSHWRFLRLRPQNFPHIRISQLANLYFRRAASLSSLVECDTLEKAQALFRTQVTPYWETHYAFSAESERMDKVLSKFSSHLIMINTVVPMLFAYGRHRMDERLCERAFEFLEQMKPESNSIVRAWREAGIAVSSAADSQAVIQLQRSYCDRRDCLRCRFGYEYLRQKPSKSQTLR